MYRLLLVSVLSTVLVACGSSGGGGGSQYVAISDNETYRGQFAAAVSPVEFSGGSETDRRWLQREIVRVISESGTFATVLPLSARGESNEAEVLIDPTVVRVQRYSGGLNRIDLRLRARRKTTGAPGLDKVYKGKRSGSRSAIVDATAMATPDLRRNYGNRPVY